MTDDANRLSLLGLAYEHGLAVVRDLRAAGVTTPIKKLGVESTYSWMEVGGYFEGPAFFRSNVSEFEIYTMKDGKDRSVRAPTVAEAVALAAKDPVLAPALGFGTIETGGEVYALVTP